jgi:hypothetical protein
LTVFGTISSIFHENETGTSSKVSKIPKHFANLARKSIKIGWGRGAILMFFGPNLQNILGFWGFLMGGGGILLKNWRDFGENVENQRVPLFIAIY